MQRRGAATFLPIINMNALFENDILSGEWHAYNQLKSQVTLL